MSQLFRILVGLAISAFIFLFLRGIGSIMNADTTGDAPTWYIILDSIFCVALFARYVFEVINPKKSK
jgi:hypothetical protein